MGKGAGGIHFHVASSSWYAATAMSELTGSETDFVMIVDRDRDMEFQVVFGSFGAGRRYCRVKVFDDAFAAFDAMVDLKAFIASGSCKTPGALKAFLEEHGAVDMTSTEPPDGIIALRRSGLGKLDPAEIEALGLGTMAGTRAG